MKSRQWLGGFLMLLLAAFVAAGCGASEDDGGDTTSERGDFDGNITIGQLVPLTGDLGPYGGPGDKAAQLAIDMLNDSAKAAGLDGTATLATEDSQTTEEGGKAAAEKLIRDEDASCIAGDWASPSVIAIARTIAIPDEVPMISPSATAAEITDLEDDNLVFRASPSDALQSQVIADAISEDLGGQGTVSIGARNGAYGEGLATDIAAALTERGLTANDPVLYDPAQPTFDSEAGQLVEGNPDAFVIVDYPEVWQKLGGALARTGDWDPAKTWGTDGMRSTDLPKTAGEELTEGMRGTAPTSVDAPAEDAFAQAWKDADNGARQTYDAANFDAVALCYLAAAAAGSTEGRDIADALSEVSGPPGEKITLEDFDRGLELLLDGEDIDYEGASGPLDLDENGDPASANYELWSYTGGALKQDEIIAFSAAGDTEGEEGTDEAGDTTMEDTGDAAETTVETTP